jgi:hypothetical protein
VRRGGKYTRSADTRLPAAGRVEPVFGQLKWDGRKLSMDLPACSRQAGFGEGARGVFANMLGAQCEEDREESAPGHDHFAWGV